MGAARVRRAPSARKGGTPSPACSRQGETGQRPGTPRAAPQPPPCQLQDAASVPGLPAPLAPRLHLLPPPVPSSSGCLQLQGPGDCLALCGGGAPVLFPGPGCPLPSQTRSRPPSPAAGCSRKREAKAGPRSLPGLPLPAPPPPCRFGVGGGPGPLTREGGQPGGDKARLGSRPLGHCRTLDVGECLRAPGGSAGPGVQGLGCETWGWPEAWVWPPLGQTLRALQGRGSPGLPTCAGRSARCLGGFLRHMG